MPRTPGFPKGATPGARSATFTTAPPEALATAADQIAREVLAAVDAAPITDETRTQVAAAMRTVADQLAAYDATDRPGLRPTYRPRDALMTPDEIADPGIRAALLTLVVDQLIELRDEYARDQRALAATTHKAAAFIFQVGASTSQPFTTIRNRLRPGA